MPHHHGPLGPKDLRELLGAVDRAVLAARAPERHGEIAAVFIEVVGEPLLEKGGNVLNHLGHDGLGRKIVNDVIVLAGLRLEGFDVVGVGQAAYVKDQIRIERNAFLERKRLKQQHEPPCSQAHQLSRPRPKR